MKELPTLGETYTSTYPTKSAKWVKAIYDTWKSWFCKGLAAKLWEPVDLKLHCLWKSQEGRDNREWERIWKKEPVKEEDKKKKAMEMEDLKRRAMKQPL